MRPALGVITMLHAHEQQGGDANAVLARLGLTLERLDAARPIARALESAIHDEMARTVGNAQAGLRIGQHLGTSGYGLYLTLLMNCATVRQWLEVAVAHQAMTFLFSRLSLHPEGEGATPNRIGLVLDLEGVPSDTWRFRIDTEMSGMFGMLADLGKALSLPASAVQVALPFAAPTKPTMLKAYRQRYGAHVSFGHARACMWVDGAVLDWPIPGADPAALAVLKNQCAPVVSCHAHSSNDKNEGEWTMQVRLLMELVQGGVPEAAAVAQALGVSERALRYRLSLEGCNYRQLREQVLCERACRLLCERPWSVERIAAHLAYADAAAFIHAFRRWSGITPCQMRARQREGQVHLGAAARSRPRAVEAIGG